MARLPGATVAEKLALNVRQDGECLRWTGARSRTGYGYLHFPGTKSVHRVAWIVNRGPIPSDLEIDHLCRVRDCINLDHLELVTRIENLRRAAAAKVPRAVCAKGHPLTGANLLQKRGDGYVWFRCRRCFNDNRILRRAIRREARTSA